MLAIKLLGQFSVTVDGRSLEIPSRPAQLLFVYLLLNAGTPQPREVLAGVLWPDSAEDNARANLRHALWQLRSTVDEATGSGDPAVLHTPHEITFNSRCDHELDIETLARERPWTTAALLEAAGAYHGKLLPGYYESWIVQERERLAAIFERRMIRLLERLMDEGRWEETLAWAERWIALDEAPEPAYQALMQAYAARGDSSGVMVAFRRCHEALREELGVEPSTETRRLMERLTCDTPFLAVETTNEPRVRQRVGTEPPPGLPDWSDRPAIEKALAIAKYERVRADRYRLLLALITAGAALTVWRLGRKEQR